MLNLFHTVISLKISCLKSTPGEFSMKRQSLVLTLLLGLCVLGTLSTAQAQDGCGGYGWGCDSGYGWMYNSLRYEVPHFAAFPPVYYSYPVARTYGYSPFAYPPYVMTPAIAEETAK